MKIYLLEGNKGLCGVLTAEQREYFKSAGLKKIKNIQFVSACGNKPAYWRVNNFSATENKYYANFSFANNIDYSLEKALDEKAAFLFLKNQGLVYDVNFGSVAKKRERV
jgi:hypothetical protein